MVGWHPARSSPELLTSRKYVFTSRLKLLIYRRGMPCDRELHGSAELDPAQAGTATDEGSRYALAVRSVRSPDAEAAKPDLDRGWHADRGGGVSLLCLPRQPATERSYAAALSCFRDFCAGRGVTSLHEVSPALLTA